MNFRNRWAANKSMNLMPLLYGHAFAMSQILKIPANDPRIMDALRIVYSNQMMAHKFNKLDERILEDHPSTFSRELLNDMDDVRNFVLVYLPRNRLFSNKSNKRSNKRSNKNSKNKYYSERMKIINKNTRLSLKRSELSRKSPTKKILSEIKKIDNYFKKQEKSGILRKLYKKQMTN
jgi:hypothetical protein